MQIETVKIINKDDEEGYCIINACDLTDDDMLFDKKAQKAREKAQKGGKNTEPDGE